MKTSDELNELAKAMAAAQAQMKPASEDAINPHFRSKYSDLTSIWDAIRIPLTSNGLTVWQDIQTTDVGLTVTTRIVHQSGQWAEFGPLTIPLTKRDAHAVGSACTYGKRYALCACLGVVSGDERDDDGNAAKEAYKEDPKPPTKITDEQYFELEELVDRLPEERRKNFLTYATNAFGKLSELKTDQYEKVKGNLIRALNEKPKAES